MNIDNPTGYDSKKIRAITLYTGKHWCRRPGRPRPAFVRIRYNSRVSDRSVTWAYRRFLPGGGAAFTIRVPRGLCPVRSIAEIIYAYFAGAWPPSGGEYYDEIETKFGLVLLDNPYSKRLARRRARIDQ